MRLIRIAALVAALAAAGSCKSDRSFYRLPDGYAVRAIAAVHVRDEAAVDVERRWMVGHEESIVLAIREKYPELFASLIDEGKLLYECGDGSTQTLELAAGQSIADPDLELTEAQLDEMLETCMDLLSDELGLDGGISDPGYGRLVDEAVAETEQRMGACVSGYDGRVAAGERGRQRIRLGESSDVDVSPSQMVESPSDPEEVLRRQQAWAEWMERRTFEPSGPSIDARSGNWEVKESDDDVTYTRTNDDGSKTEFVCPKGGGSCTVKEDPPPPPPPPPEDPPPPPPPSTGDDASSAGRCLEQDCTSTCDEVAEWWKRFKSECDRVGWRTYQCASYVAAMNGCPDPAVVRPTPDGDFVCSPRATAGDIAAARQMFCDFQGGMMRTDREGSRSCRIAQERPRDPRFDICSDPRALVTPEQCVLDFEIDVGGGRPGGGSGDPDRRP